MSAEAGVAFVKSALPFVGLLKKGIDLVTGNAKDSTLEIGLSTELEQPRMGWYLVMAGPKEEIKADGLRVDPNDSRLLDKNGKPYLKHAYILFNISASLQRSDWFQVPELVEPHLKLREALRENDLARAEKLLDQFVMITKTCPDLLSVDADRICESLKTRYHIESSKAVSKDPTAEGMDIGNLEALKIYG
jgi:hypothetical protein